MARVVQRRSGPPYLLIIFVFLFLIATTVAVLLYVQKKDIQEANADLKDSLAVLATPEQRRHIVPLVKPRLEGKETVLDHLWRNTRDLTQRLTGNPDLAPGVALEQARALTDEALAPYATTLEKQVAGKTAEVDDWMEKAAAAQTKLATAQQEVSKLIAKHKERLTGLNAQISDLRSKLDAAKTAGTQALASEQKNWQQIRSELEKDKAVLANKIDKLEVKKIQLDTQVSQLKEQIRNLKGKGDDAIKVAQKPDGKILRVVEDEDLLFINRGATDDIRPGMTFAVYGPDGIPASGDGKGSVVVTNISPHVSECRVLVESKDDPIVAGNTIGNIAYDQLQEYKFAVKGNFDLYGEGRATALGAEEIKNIINRFGGEVVDGITVETDFVVLGEQPAKPAKPAENAEPAVIEVYNQQLKDYESFRAMQLVAQSMNIPMLNANRFLAFTGYKPQRVTSE